MTGLVSFIVVLSYLIIALTVITKTQGGRRKLIALAIVLLIPTADSIVGHLYFRYLCLVYSGQFIYQTVELSDEYILKPGDIDEYRRGDGPRGRAIADGGEINRMKLRERYDISSVKRNDYSWLFNIYRTRSAVRDKTSGQVLSEVVTFNHRLGWVFNLYPHGPTVYCCDDQKPTAKISFHNIIDRTFLTK